MDILFYLPLNVHVVITFIIIIIISERRKYCVARRHAVTLCVCVSAALVLAAKVMRCIQRSLAIIIIIIVVVVVVVVESGHYLTRLCFYARKPETCARYSHHPLRHSLCDNNRYTASISCKRCHCLSSSSALYSAVCLYYAKNTT